jgi:general secretion pathway protein A
MYYKYFGFSDAPFENNLDQRFLFFSANHAEVSAALLYFIKWKKGFALVCGDVGTGKTMLINYLLSRLPDSVHPILIANPDVGYVEILRIVAGVLKTDVKGKRVYDLVEHVKAALVEADRQGESFVLIIDEAQLLPDKIIDQIRLLSNIETQEHKLFQILLLGQYELSYKLSRPEMRQLRQRININRFLAPMDAAETIQYIDHRLKMAGSSFDACFEPHCRRLIFKMTNGVPRSINQLCDSALLVCMTEKLQMVNRKVLKMAGTDLRSDVLFTPRSHADSTASTWKTIRLMAAFVASAVIWALLGIYGYQGMLGERTQNFLHRLSPLVLMPPATGQQPVSETATNPEMLTAVIKPVSGDSAKLPDSATDKVSEIENSSPPLPSGQQASENHNQESDPGAALPEIKQPLQKDALVSPGEIIGNVAISSLLHGKDVQPKTETSLPHDPKRVVVKNGDTLFGLASRFFPKNKVDGVKKILAANSMVDDMHRIYPGQKLIIPEIGSDRKGLN